MTRVGPRGAWAVLATLGILVAVDVPELGSAPWPFHGVVQPHGLFARLVRAAGRRTVVEGYSFTARMRKVRAVYDGLLGRN